MPYTEEQENYFKLITLIYCLGANVNRELLDKFISSRNITLEKFINDHQHEIYHFFCNARCCQCQPDRQTTKLVISHKQMLTIFETPSNDRLENHKQQKRGQLCCLKANKNVKLTDLDFTLIRFFLVHFCYEIFWDCHLKSGKQTFSEFLVANVHKVYHLSVDKICCCKCNDDRDIPKKLINEAQFRIIYKKGRLPCHHQYCSCQYSIQSDLTLSYLIQQDKNLTTELTRYCCSCFKCLENIYENRNKIAHPSESSINNDTFSVIWNETATNILEIAKALNQQEQYDSQLKKLRDEPTNKDSLITLLLNLRQTSDHETSNCLQKIDSKADSIETKIADVFALLKDIQNAKGNTENSENDCTRSILDRLQDIAIAVCKESTTESNPDYLREMDIILSVEIRNTRKSSKLGQDEAIGDSTHEQCKTNCTKLDEFSKKQDKTQLKITEHNSSEKITYKIKVAETGENWKRKAMEKHHSNLGYFDTDEAIGDSPRYGQCQTNCTNVNEFCKRQDTVNTTVMPTLAEDINTTTSRQLQSTPKVEDDRVPMEIKLMSDKQSVPLYLKLLESGSKKKRDIRLVIVGKKGAGKTSLLKRLFGEVKHNIQLTGTNGIEINKIRCHANYDDGEWYKLEGNNEETERHARLLKPYEETLFSQRKRHMEAPVEATAKKATKKSSETILYMRESKESEAASLQSEKNTHSVTTNFQVDHPVGNEHQPSHLLLEQSPRDIEDMLQSEIDLYDKEKYATLSLWDFAGDEEFYHTHQTFLSPDAIYLVVAKLNEVDDKKAHDLFQFWMDSIHCYSRMDERNNEYEDRTRIVDDIDPPVVLVGTWKDSVTSETEEIEEICRETIFRYAKNMSDDELRHIRDEVFISNTEDDNSVFQQIRQNILKLARTMRTWNKDYPLKFIQLDERLQEKKKELPIITFQELKHISTETTEPLRNEELILYLKFHHEIRALVYFEDLPDYIILDTQWLSDAFKSIVTAKKYRVISIKNQQLWKEFYHKGKLHKEVLEDIFKKEETSVYKYKEHILNVMEKFDIIIRPIKSEMKDAEETSCYYVPCTIKAEPECDIYKMFNVTEDNCQKSSWLCFKFRFLPPHLMHHVIASLCRRYEVAEVGVLQQEERQKSSQRDIALFRETAVFELRKTTKLSKLLITTCPNLILVQVLEFGKSDIIDRGIYKYIDDFVTDEINKIIGTRFKMTNVRFEKKWECGLVKPQSVIGSNNFTEEQNSEYYCEICANVHKFKDEWSDLQSETLCMSQSSGKTLEGNDKTETTSKNQTMSTKVRVHVGGRYELPPRNPRTCSSLTGFTKEEVNFAKMSIIVLNILTDVLYDLLKPDKPHLRPRLECDISYLYREHRKLNKHIPSNSWGGEWSNIQYTDVAVGDDIERIRLTRNELRCSTRFLLDDNRFVELNGIIVDILKRFNLHNTQAWLYTDHLKKILDKPISVDEFRVVKNEMSDVSVEVEIEELWNLSSQ